MTKRCPIIGDYDRRKSEPYGSVPWDIAVIAHKAYVAKYGNIQSLERIAERGGFGYEEMDEFCPGWREHFKPRI